MTAASSVTRRVDVEIAGSGSKPKSASAVHSVARAQLEEQNEVEAFFSRYPGGAQSFAFEVQVIAFTDICQAQPPEKGINIFAGMEWMPKIHLFIDLIAKPSASNSLSCYLSCQSRLTEFPVAASMFVDTLHALDIDINLKLTADQDSQIAAEIEAREGASKDGLPVEKYKIREFATPLFQSFYHQYLTKSIHHLHLSWQNLATFFGNYSDFLTPELRSIVLQYTYDAYEGNPYSTFLADMRYQAQRRTNSKRAVIEAIVFKDQTAAQKRVTSARLDEVLVFHTNRGTRENICGDKPLENWPLGTFSHFFDEKWMRWSEKEIQAVVSLTKHPKLPLDEINYRVFVQLKKTDAPHQ